MWLKRRFPVIIFLCCYFSSTPSESTFTLPSSATTVGYHEGTIGSGNYSYFEIEVSRKLASSSVEYLILLETLTGDVDLYVSGGGKRPTFELNKHDFKSTTCGNDTIYIPASYAAVNSPLVIGVYGECVYLTLFIIINNGISSTNSFMTCSKNQSCSLSLTLQQQQHQVIRVTHRLPIQ